MTSVAVASGATWSRRNGWTRSSSVGAVLPVAAQRSRSWRHATAWKVPASMWSCNPMARSRARSSSAALRVNVTHSTCWGSTCSVAIR